MIVPPNAKGGSSFVNDPMMTDCTTVKAHIKLRFQNRSDQTCVAVRSLQVTKKKAKLEFKQLDSVMRTTNQHGEKVSISMKCSDIDRIIPENLGISPAILENVIFVHQEDSSWPMQESGTLKKKFDEVFESTRYTKALEALQKSKKEFIARSKDLKADLMELNAHLMSANLFHKDLLQNEEYQEDCKVQLDRLIVELEDNEERHKKCIDALAKVRESQAKLQLLESKVNIIHI